MLDRGYAFAFIPNHCISSPLLVRWHLAVGGPGNVRVYLLGQILQTPKGMTDSQTKWRIHWNSSRFYYREVKEISKESVPTYQQ